MLLKTLLTILLTTSLAHSEEKTPQEQPNTVIDKTHGLLSRGILGLTDSVDSFFGDDKLVKNAKTSAGIIALTSTLTDGEGLQTQGKLSLQIRLPKTESRLKIVIDNVSDETRTDEVEPTQLEKAKSETEDNGIAAALKYLINLGDNWEVNTNAGVKIKIPLDPFISLRANRNYDIWRWKLGVSQNFFWFDSLGFGEVTRADMDFPLPDAFILRFSNSASWLKNEKFFRINNSLTLIHPIGGDRALSYAVGASGTTDNSLHAETYSVAASYRQKIFRKWMFLDIIPGFTFARSNDFNGVASIAVRIESVFGKVD